MHPADYVIHDAEYVRRRAAGNPGWQTAEALAEHLAVLEPVISK
jgi:hypothetical protein